MAGGREFRESDPFPTAMAQNGALFVFTLSAIPQHAPTSEPSSPLAPAAGQQGAQPPAQDWVGAIHGRSQGPLPAMPAILSLSYGRLSTGLNLGSCATGHSLVSACVFNMP
jgi:hypothetical protein